MYCEEENSSPHWKLLFSRGRRSAAEQFTIKLPLPARAEYALRSGHICASLWTMWISLLCKYVKYVNITSVQVCKYMKYVNFVWSHLCIKLTQGLLFPPLHWLISLYWDQEARAGYIWRIILSKCAKEKLNHINLLRVSSYWKLLKLIGWQNCCAMSCRVIVARYQWLNSDFSIQRIFPHCQDIGSNSNIFGSLFCMWVQKVLAIETNWATKCLVIRAHYQWLTLTND